MQIEPSTTPNRSPFSRPSSQLCRLDCGDGGRQHQADHGALVAHVQHGVAGRRHFSRLRRLLRRQDGHQAAEAFLLHRMLRDRGGRGARQPAAGQGRQKGQAAADAEIRHFVI